MMFTKRIRTPSSDGSGRSPSVTREKTELKTNVNISFGTTPLTHQKITENTLDIAHVVCVRTKEPPTIRVPETEHLIDNEFNGGFHSVFSFHINMSMKFANALITHLNIDIKQKCIAQNYNT